MSRNSQTDCPDHSPVLEFSLRVVGRNVFSVFIGLVCADTLSLTFRDVEIYIQSSVGYISVQESLLRRFVISPFQNLRKVRVESYVKRIRSFLVPVWYECSKMIKGEQLVVLHVQILQFCISSKLWCRQRANLQLKAYLEALESSLRR